MILGGGRIVLDPDRSSESPTGGGRVDYSTPEAEEAMRTALALVLEIREEVTSPLARKVALYERTLGFAVVPVLLRRAILAAWRRIRRGLRLPR